MKTTQRFHVLRSRDLSDLFSIQNLINVWRDSVRESLREQDILDLYDYYDFNFNIDRKCEFIRSKLLEGGYHAKAPLSYRIEKKHGICRHVLLPNSIDALILQTIVDKSLASQILNSQPTKKAFYSRKTRNKKKELISDYEWSNRWKKYKTVQYKIASTKKYIAVTDVNNYYNSIYLRELRRVIASFVSVPEVVLDLLFNTLERLSSPPDYLPSSFRGLPVIDMEAPRLLAHSLLYEIDTILDHHTKGEFVRWVDDITFGVDTYQEACLILGIVNDTLKSRGLSLNLGKTKIFKSKKFLDIYLFKEHNRLDSIEKKMSREKGLNNEYKLEEVSSSIKKDLCAFFVEYQQKETGQEWERILKRLLTNFGKTKSDSFNKEAKRIFYEYPNSRKNVGIYFSSLGYSETRMDILYEIITSSNIYDDISLFYIVKAIIQWKIPFSQKEYSRLDKTASILSKHNDFLGFYCSLWLSAKYRKPEDLISFILSNKSFWENDPFLRRQVVSILPRIFPYRPEWVEDRIEEELINGVEESASVASNIKYLSQLETIPFKINSYLFPTQKQKIYPLPKYLILFCCLQSRNIQRSENTRKKVSDYVKDPWMQHWISLYHF